MSFEARKAAAEERKQRELELQKQQAKQIEEEERRQLQEIENDIRYKRMKAVATSSEVHEAMCETLVKLVSKKVGEQAIVTTTYTPTKILPDYMKSDFGLGRFNVRAELGKYSMELTVMERTKPLMGSRNVEKTRHFRAGGGKYLTTEFYEKRGEGIELNIEGQQGSRNFNAYLRANPNDYGSPISMVLDFLADVYVGGKNFIPFEAKS